MQCEKGGKLVNKFFHYGFTGDSFIAHSERESPSPLGVGWKRGHYSPNSPIWGIIPGTYYR